ncbi:hypothetical protein FACS1894151_08070 [Spirochaetia bacterium]|nr:hypothetical protein FACS1894151_08070 [Spirochaetia bacterium]
MAWNQTLEQIRRGKQQIIDMDKKEYDLLRGGVKIGTVSCRITNQAGGVYGKDGSLDAKTLNTTPYVLAEYDAPLQENDRLVLGYKMWTVGAVSRPTPAGSTNGPSCVQAPVVYNGETAQ